jgi:hypothetical protein
MAWQPCGPFNIVTFSIYAEVKSDARSAVIAIRPVIAIIGLVIVIRPITVVVSAIAMVPVTAPIIVIAAITCPLLRPIPVVYVDEVTVIGCLNLHRR